MGAETSSEKADLNVRFRRAGVWAVTQGEVRVSWSFSLTRIAAKPTGAGGHLLLYRSKVSKVVVLYLYLIAGKCAKVLVVESHPNSI